MCGKHFQIYGVHIPRKCIEFIFTHSPVSHSKLQAEFFENLFPPTAERGRENYDLLYQHSIRKYEDDLEHCAIYFLYDL